MELERESILGLDNIRLGLPVAGVGSRTLAGLVDYLCLGVVVAAWLVICAVIGWLDGDWGIALVVVGLFLLEWCYFSILEVVTGGRTLGKRAVGLRVVTAEGAAPGAGALVTRNLVRSLDLLFGVPLMALDPMSRRLGDRLAGTVVVHDRRRGPEPLLGRTPPGWGAREVAVVEAFLAREGELEDAGRSREMALRLLARVERDAPGFLDGVDQSDPVRALREALQVERV
ncbi:MAG TPA: RDD family protein [Thermoanaerobaculia bacterium]|nr:RDD family protein [Thermoanaerobaculia bacterium]